MHPELLSLFLFMLGTSCSPGPNNIVASYSGFNFGVIRTLPHILGVVIGFTLMIIVLNFGLINIFKLYPLLQEILKISGSIFLVYLAYKIAFSKNIDQERFCIQTLFVFYLLLTVVDSLGFLGVLHKCFLDSF